LSFETHIEFKEATDTVFAAPPNIWFNFNKDRICPMGYYLEDGAANLWFTDPTPRFCTLNACQKPGWGDSSLSSFIAWADESKDDELDIFLYYNEFMCTRPGRFEFVKVSEEQTTPCEWEALNKAKKQFLDKFTKINSPISLYGEDGAPSDSPELLANCHPNITFVALMVNDVRR
jgi:hypothetical protein